MGQVVTLEDNFGMKQKFTNYLKENCRKHSDEQFLFRYFINFAFVREISLNPSGNFGWVNSFTLRTSLESIVCYFHIFEKNFGIKQKFTIFEEELLSGF